MPATADELVALLDLETIDLNLFRGQQPNTTMQRVFGGQVAAQALVAATRTVPDDMAVHSLHSYFMRPGDTSVPIVYDVERVRDGRSFTTRRALARQHGRPIYAMTASYQRVEEGFDHQDPMPEVPSPAESTDIAAALSKPGSEHRQEWLREWAALELRHAGNPTPGARSRYWVKTAQELPDQRLVHEAVLTYLSDMTLIGVALVPYGRTPSSPDVQVASLDHTIWFHRPFRADEWLLYDQSSPSASGARGLALGRLFTEDGRLVATVAQEGLIRPR
ncbi:acyl-CoA thioesterase [Nocardioides caldifontis]|uniref:acyl-CoA thioesterase n=1 Tax=Nocardioides caldifontis TaxID=2588938 RepID=UPI0011E06530|nr:acyl-CoA thioesterase II [Nocardioides caldifontis]